MRRFWKGVDRMSSHSDMDRRQIFLILVHWAFCGDEATRRLKYNLTPKWRNLLILVATRKFLCA